MDVHDAHKNAYREEAYELLIELEKALLLLESQPDDNDLISRVFRSMHTIKGSGAMFGFTDISQFTHEVETVFDQVRNGLLRVDKELIDATLKAGDQIRAMLDGGDVDMVEQSRLLAVFKHMADSCVEAKPVGLNQACEPLSAGKDNDKIYRIRFKPHSSIFLTGTDPVVLLDELRQLGECKVVANLNGIPSLTELDPEHCHFSWDIILTTCRGQNAIKDVFIFVDDDCELKIEVIAECDKTDIGPNYKRLGEILVERGDLTSDDMEVVLRSQKRFGEIVVETGLASPSQVESALLEQKHVREAQQKRQNNEAAASIRVPSEKLDKLVDLVGELVTVQARLSQTAGSRSDPIIASIAEEVERLTGELRDNTLNIRMMPIGVTFSKFTRLVRDLSAELGKEIEMTTEGAETELDKTVIEKLNDPLVHLIRNSIDHGVELPEKRLAAGKPRHGTIALTAVHSGDSVLVTIRDDGAGLDSEAIRAKAVERGVISEQAELSEKDLFALIFASGFSTAKKVTGVSGRGVGMDVVKRAIEALRGSIEISSRRGTGTTISVRLPLTLAIIESLLVNIAGESFVIPLSQVEECVELTREDVASAHGRHLAKVRGNLVPYIPLRERFRMSGQPPGIQQIVITVSDGRRVGFVVDKVIGEHQTVIKSLGKTYRNVSGVSGATILGDGSVALILDVAKLVHAAEEEQQAE